MSTVLSQEGKLSPAQEKFKEKILNPLFFWWYLMANVPAGWIAGMRLKSLESAKAIATIPFKFLNKNPFQSIYFAVQSMAAELSTAALVMLHIQGQKPSIAFIIVDMQATFPKKAVGKTYFTCEGGRKVQEAVAQCLASGEATVVDLQTTGKMADGTVVAEFTFRWSLKQRSK